MLMMLGEFWGVSAADAHDAGRVWWAGEQWGQLMFMMEDLGGVRAADAQVAGDARDAGQFWGVGEESGQPMLMMLAGFGGGWGRARAPDAHDAGRLWVRK